VDPAALGCDRVDQGYLDRREALFKRGEGVSNTARRVARLLARTLGGYRIGYDLPAMDLRRLASVDRGVFPRPVCGWSPGKAGPDPLLHDRFKLRRCLLVHAAMSL
jgi:hypothetical protein